MGLRKMKLTLVGLENMPGIGISILDGGGLEIRAVRGLEHFPGLSVSVSGREVTINAIGITPTMPAELRPAIRIPAKPGPATSE